MQSITEKDGLVGNIVNDLTFDEDGNLWVLTNKGLNKYNGSEWEFWDSMHGKSTISRIGYYLYADKGKFTMLSPGRLLEYDNDGVIEEKFIHNYNEIINFGFIENKKGEKVDYFLSKDSLLFRDNYNWFVIDLELTKMAYVNYVNDKLSIIFEDRVYNLEEKRNIITVNDIESKIGVDLGNLLFLEQDKINSNILLLVFEKSILRLDAYSNRIIDYHSIDLGVKRSFPFEEKIKIYYGSNDIKLLLVNGQLFFSKKNGKFLKIYTNNQDVESWVRAVALDQNNSICIGTGRGVLIIKNLAFQYIDNAAITTNETTVIGENELYYWFGGHNILYNSDKYFSEINKVKSFQKNSRLLTSYKNKGYMYFTSDRKNVFCVDSSNKIIEYNNSLFDDYFINDLYVDSTHFYFIGNEIINGLDVQVGVFKDQFQNLGSSSF